MTSIITITGGMAGVGKTHLAVNLALELVRRGRQVGLFHVPGGSSPIERFIDVQPLFERRQQAETEMEHWQVRYRGYLGIDILSSEASLADRVALEPDELTGIAQAMDIEGGYDFFIVDTSGMGAREQLSCCLASPVIMLTMTPDPQSQAEAFALLRVLMLNGFSGELRLLVNRVTYAMDAQDIYQVFSAETVRHLDVEPSPPWALVEDSNVTNSERYRQAFSAVYPDSDVSAGIVVIADEVDAWPEQYPGSTLVEWWDHLTGIAGGPVHLPGKVLLDDWPAEGLPESRSGSE